MSPTFLNDLQAELLECAERLSATDRRSLSVNYKADGSPVTSADLDYQAGFMMSVQKYFGDDVEFICEELESIQPDSDIKCFIDPIDGTENFMAGLPIWGCSISLWDVNEPIYSIIIFPDLKFYQSSLHRIERKFRSELVGLPSRILGVDVSEIFGEGGSRILGSLVYNCSCVFSGSLSRYTNPGGAYVWDFAAIVHLARINGYHTYINNIVSVSIPCGLRGPVEFKILRNY